MTITEDGLTARLGQVVFRCEPRGTHYHVTVRGHGTENHRPLLGSLVMEPGEWHDIADLAQPPALQPVENMALTIALAQIERGDEVPANTTAALILALARLVGR